MKKHELTILGLILILLLVFVFYWYEWRPVEIRKSCHKKAVEASSDQTYRDSDFEKSVAASDNTYHRVFSKCCRENGLKE